MSSFYGYNFIYNDIPSQRFDLKIVNFEESALFSGVGSSDVKILTDRVFKKSKVFYLGRIQEPVLEFPISFGRAQPISALDRDLISQWLFGKSGYKKLYIMQDDLNGAYFNCILKSPQPLYIGNVNYGFKAVAVCDSPFAYGFLKTYGNTYISTGDTEEKDNIQIYNYSTDDDYIYPIIKFTTKSAGYTFLLTNQTDNNRSLYIDWLSGSTEYEINNDLKLIRKNGTYIAPSDYYYGSGEGFNKVWFRLLPGVNNIEMEAPVASYSIEFNERLKIGG